MKPQHVALLALISAGNSWGAAGFWDSFVFTTTTGNAPLAFYDIGAATANPDFQGSNLGNFTVGDTLYLGGQQKSWKDNFTDVTGHSISWRVYSGSPSGTFTTVNLPFQWNKGDPGAPGFLANDGDQQWGGDSQGANVDPVDVSGNVLSGLTPGTYTLEVYSQVNTNNVNEAAIVYNGNGGNNYKASFNVLAIPEPASALLGALGALTLLRRRR